MIYSCSDRDSARVWSEFVIAEVSYGIASECFKFRGFVRWDSRS